ncbi:MAG TPA: hypothetical protein VE175_06680 [Woeseiaceae bacterium]|nr:hypothetical protein [Woeseiaceae bacterium]
MAASVLIVPLLMTTAMPASAQGSIQISGTGRVDTFPPTECTNAPPGFEDFTVVLEGDLMGCLYTAVASPFEYTPSNVYDERGRESIEACLDLNRDLVCDGPSGTFQTNYYFISKWEGVPFFSEEIFGRCEHPIVWGLGTGLFSDATGRLKFRDDVIELDFDWKGHIKL